MKLKITNPSKLRGRKLHWPEWVMEVTANLMTVDDGEYVFTCDAKHTNKPGPSKRFHLHLNRESLLLMAVNLRERKVSTKIQMRLDEVKDTDRLVDRMMHLINEII